MRTIRIYMPNFWARFIMREPNKGPYSPVTACVLW